MKQLRRALEKILGPREEWRLPLLRELWSAVAGRGENRRRSADHERMYFQLAGYCLRPGLAIRWTSGAASNCFGCLAKGSRFTASRKYGANFGFCGGASRAAWAKPSSRSCGTISSPTCARRLAPGTPPKGAPKAKGVQPEGLDEMVRVAAALEHLDPAEKTVLGHWMLEQLKKPDAPGGKWAWALGRLGARVPVHGSSHKTVDPRQAAAWLAALLELGLEGANDTAFAAVQLGRLTGDRSRDLDEEIRTRTAAALRAAKAPDEWHRLLTEVVALSAPDEARALGDTLPIGLRLH